MFTKGIAKIGGRKKGTPNKLTGTFREAVCSAYERIGGHERFAEWAAQNPTEFYRIAARLIPTENKNSDSEGITVIIDRAGMDSDRLKDTEIARSRTAMHTIDATQKLRPALMEPALHK